MSRAAIQSSRAWAPAVSMMSRAPSSLSGRGSLRRYFGPRAARTAVASVPLRSLAQAMKPLTA